MKKKEEEDRLSPNIRDSATRSVLREKLQHLEKSLDTTTEEEEDETSIDESFKRLFTSLRNGAVR